MKELLLLSGVLALWFVLGRWVLPWMGIPTCMSGNCGASCRCATEVEPLPEHDAEVCQPADEQK